MILFEITQFMKWSQERWEKFSTLIILLIAISLLLIFKFTDTSINDLSIWDLIFIISFDSLLLGLWLKSNALPHAKKGKIGFAVAIACETRDLQKKIKADFISSLRQLINRQTNIFQLDLVEIPERYSRSIKSVEEAIGIRRKARCHYFIYGSAREREINNSKTHVLNLEINIAMLLFQKR